MKELLKFDDVSLIYHSPEGETNAIQRVNFSVYEGEFISIIGPSGCGKTTLLSMVSGLLKPSAGTILLEGNPVLKPSSEIAYMLQRDQLFPWRNIFQNVCLGLEIKGKKNKENLDEINRLLKKYGLWDFCRAKPSQLSGGMRQRVALIRTLAVHPKLLLLDEPISALDYQTKLSVCDDVSAIISTEKKTAILVTHDISEAISLSDRVVVLSKRPATVKKIFEIPLREYGSPLKRREHALFPTLFEQIYQEISDENTED